MKLEVGKTYKTREGEIVKIDHFTPHNSWAYRGMMHGVLHKWFENGQWWVGSIESKYDLIEEVTPTPTTPS